MTESRVVTPLSAFAHKIQYKQQKKEISICVAGMVVVTIVAASVITAAAGAGITGDVAVPADGTGITREAFRNGFREGYDAGFRDGFRKDGTMTADRADLEVRAAGRWLQFRVRMQLSYGEISMPLMCVVKWLTDLSFHTILITQSRFGRVTGKAGINRKGIEEMSFWLMPFHFPNKTTLPRSD